MDQIQQKTIDEAQQSLEEIAKLCNQQLENPPDEGYKESQILLIRHGFSEYNYSIDTYHRQHDQKNIHTEECRSIRLNVNDIDTPLHPIGIEQAKNSQKYVNDLDVHTVFISPLFRTLQTADLLFANHPQKHLIKYIVLPELSEGLCFSCSFAPLAFSDIRKNQFNNFDFSLGQKFSQKPAWQIEQIACQDTMSRMQEKIKDIHDQDKLSEIYLQELDSLYPSYIETHDHLWIRAQQARKYIEEYQKTVPKDKKIIIVSHYILGLFLTSSKRSESFHDMDGVRCKNSKLIPWKI
ncbi:histidine phosphatase family (branch protein 1) (macronuclear) [Tetrahymena thermophila SB210]|uniref:Histidine phosphatase family (Branch protein 1) n=1 Tax=Tetrahymena thermophila (strain SB210) TaxID=312017 RepID=W7X057_TETTS|nr:histidine phosphatase family (branch protein 1) [Tetrahymena thermophila SB210]EWS72485.1 histidine phosphatase family (branch protein 1) [Tetrahymena thermophila SB210]|eukprot:XP_012654982.1 histidine phosphatase family (branch protein 1) [Tetrahymena thermophila SB210]